ncbi:MAG: RidA family protein [Marinilabiliales bacterium]
MKKIIQTEKAPKAIGPYNQAVLIKDTLYVSGQISIDPETSEFVGSNVTEQTKKVLENVKAILAEVDMDFSNVVRTTCILKSMNDFNEMNKVYAEFFTDNQPARVTFGNTELPKGALVEIAVIAVK